MSIPRHRRSAALAALGAVVLTLTACGSGSGTTTSAAGGQQRTALTVGVSPGAATSTPMYLAVRDGVFAELGLDLELTVLQDGTVAVPQVLNSETEFSMSGFGPAVQAIDKGLPIKLVGAANVIPTSPDSEYQAIVVNAESGIDDIRQVRTWAADTTETDPAQAFAVDALGGDYAALDRRAVPFPAIGDAVADGNADAALLNEPFLSEALGTGKVEVLSYVNGELTVPGAPGAVFIGSERYMAEHPDVTARFMRGIQRAYEHAQAHQREVAEFVPETGLHDQAPPVAALGEYQQGPLDPAKVDALLEVFRCYGAIERDFGGADIVHAPEAS
ncbi:ABC-type nitrate/sulfonate/bicarbonate transport system substrate-binding protein [Prauserella shujinwangii]|uniref:ABC-type nitrate/sulfonate/bicarbonate transport system substrate-binding protein n=1 Tax=Prauserella shujinwangii TaxID=1453103 RepID=A0A2T0LSH7_9PSEU|nr:ABC transporter substrate-binding protein [Prauserella shujinwangii]PRX46616.1 ABC-type nitrate/sulfonate/bicarbonate transport system substrate-binding protein [Prauserella shujinwangii]